MGVPTKRNDRKRDATLMHMHAVTASSLSTYKTISSGVLARLFRNLLESLSFADVVAPETNSWERQHITNTTTTKGNTNVGLLTAIGFIVFPFVCFWLLMRKEDKKPPTLAKVRSMEVIDRVQSITAT